MTQETKTGPLSEASPSITSIGSANRLRVAAVAANSDRQRVYAGDRKTLSL